MMIGLRRSTYDKQEKGAHMDDACRRRQKEASPPSLEINTVRAVTHLFIS